MIRAIGVVVPVHDEAELLPACLRALSVAIARLELRCECAIVLDACSDGSVEVARGWNIVETSVRNVGQARALGAANLLARFADLRSDEIWLATTDADSEVPANWLVDQLALAAGGADAFAGTIELAVVDAAFSRFYESLGEGDEHGHVHGANLGVRGDAYLAAGGFAPLMTGEDHALWNALAPRRRVKTRRLPVRTSARLDGRAPDGFSGFLRAFPRSE